jgi:hypothetical protein
MRAELARRHVGAPASECASDDPTPLRRQGHVASHRGAVRRRHQVPCGVVSRRRSKRVKKFATSEWGTAGATLPFASFGLWTGVLPFCIRAIRHHERRMFPCAQVCAQMAHLCFFGAVLSGALCFLIKFKLDPKYRIATSVLLTVGLATVVWSIVVCHRRRPGVPKSTA